MSASITTINPLLPAGASPSQVVRPSDVKEIQDLVKRGNEDGLHLVPVSSAAPHGKGGINCAVDHVAVDLSGWKKIHSVDRRNRVCMIDPGVTYGELLEALAPHGLTVSMPLAPRAGKSVLAAVMDREPSTWPNKQWDAGDPAGSLEFVFGTGDLFRTGSAGGPGTLESQRASGGAQKAPLGPSQTDFHRVLQGAQGSMGIIAWMTLRAEVKPLRERPLLIGADELTRLSPYVYKVQRSWLGEHSFILNRTAAAMLMSYGDPAGFAKIRASLPAFVCLQNIAGFARRPESRLDYQLKDILDIAGVAGVAPVESIGEVSASGLLQTATSPGGERDWRHALAGHCLRVFFLSTLDRAPGHLHIMEGLAAAHGVAEDRLGVYLQPVVQNHACHLEFMAPFDPADSTQVARMKELEARAVAELASAGAFFSRPYGAAERAAFTRNVPNFELLKKIKGIFDPGRVLNPGKFGL
jgi:FAD/FMN-containing dehydrogenase